MVYLKLDERDYHHWYFNHYITLDGCFLYFFMYFYYTLGIILIPILKLCNLRIGLIHCNESIEFWYVCNSSLVSELLLCVFSITWEHVFKYPALFNSILFLSLFYRIIVCVPNMLWVWNHVFVAWRAFVLSRLKVQNQVPFVYVWIVCRCLWWICLFLPQKLFVYFSNSIYLNAIYTNVLKNGNSFLSSNLQIWNIFSFL